MPKALFFDLDGTLIDSDPLHTAVFIDLLAEFGIEMDAAFYDTHIHGRQNREVFADILPNEDAAALDYEKERRFRVRLAETGASATSGAADLIARADAAGLARALVTNACAENVAASLTAIGLADAFPVRSLGDDCTNAKPDPEAYLKAAAALGIAPADGLAFEDSPSGIRAAVGAGIPTIGIRSTLDDSALRALGCSASVDDFTDPIIEKAVFG